MLYVDIQREEKILLYALQLLMMSETQTEMVRVRSDLAICILNASKKFSTDICVLNGLNMNVSLGSM